MKDARTLELNSKLQVKSIKGLKFKKANKKGYIKTRGYALFIEGLGYIAMIDDEKPYCPTGGKKALNCIVESQGLEHYEAVNFVMPV